MNPEKQGSVNPKIICSFMALAINGFLMINLLVVIFGGASGFFPVEEDTALEYQVIGSQLNVNWEWLLLIDFYHAESEGQDISMENPVYTALNCLKITIDVYTYYEDEDGSGDWEFDHTELLEGADEILGYFELPIDIRDITLVVRTIQRRNSEKYRITTEAYPDLETVLNTYYSFPEEILEEMLELEEAHYFSEVYGNPFGGSSGGIIDGEIGDLVFPAIGMKIPLYYQYQAPWGKVKFGGGTIATSGCSITCMAMIFSYLKDDTITPDQLALWAGNRYYVGSAGQSWDIFPAAASQWGVKCIGLGTNVNHVLEALSEGRPVIASVRAGTFTKNNHLIVLRGITEDGKILVNDPNDNSSKNFFHKSFDVSLIKRESKQFWCFTR